MGGGMPVSYVLTTRIQNAKIKNYAPEPGLGPARGFLLQKSGA
jgi:hypothetical protein